MTAPVFVKIDRYAEVENTLKEIKMKIEEAKSILGQLDEIKAKEEHELATWHEELSQMEDKISTVERSMTQ
ncbi:hypothetical protein HYX10_04160 [Candidatus Woesearchaeota archaeon]|nr:hypothetical protein [Candidatus Woesearchaeota archaeon]